MPQRCDEPMNTGFTTSSASIHRQLQNICQVRLESLLIEIRRTAAHPNADAIHDLRVAIRRATEVLHVMKIAAGPQRRVLTRLIKRLRLLRRTGGAVRDCDVLLQMMTRRPTPGARNAILARHIHNLTLKRIATLNTLTHKLQAGSLAPAVREAFAVLAIRPNDRPCLPLPEALELRLEKNQRRFAAMIRKAMQDPIDRRLHRARIAAKHWRYALEMYPTGMIHHARDYSRQLSQLKALQELLGHVHDLEMLRSRFAVLPADHTPGRTPTSHSAWLRQARHQQKGLIHKFLQMPLVQTMLTLQNVKI